MSDSTGDWPILPNPFYPWDPNAYWFIPNNKTTDAAKDANCPYCGRIHSTPGICYRVKATEYHPDGTVKRVELR